ncbi:MAG: hypothetical protein IJE94_04170 [Oscillospiraceae bacterium]|nr:hypothetical protein [Oscillospiraceae bacterium]
MKKIVALILALVMVMGLATVAFADTSAEDYALWKADVTAATAEQAKTSYETVAATTNATNGSGTIEHIKINGEYYVKIDAADATTLDYYVCLANDKTKAPLFYLKKVTSADVAYNLAVVNFTDIGVKCGQLNAAYADYVTNEAEFYVHTNPVTGVKTYYTDTVSLTMSAPYYGNTATNFVTIENYGNVLVDGEIVKAYKFTDGTKQVSPLNDHVWAPSAYDKTTPVKALCGLCGATAKLYEADEIPAKSVVAAVLNLGGTNYYAVADATASTPVVDGDKVESAETFDAGIAMYVGMSVMAAAGSAVVLKKKD